MIVRRGLGALLLVGAYLPAHRLLAPERTGPAGSATREAAEAAWATGVYGSILVVGVGFVLALIAPAAPLLKLVARIIDALSRPRSTVFGASAGAVAALLSAATAALLFGGLPTSVDGMAHLLHARALATGSLGLPLPGAEAAWTIQNGIVTGEGWASIYPPLHTAALASALAVGAAWLVGPLAIGVGTAAASFSLERLLGSRPGRAAAALLAVTPFWILLGGTHLSHTTAAAGLCLVLWTGLRARDGRAVWGLATGAAVGLAVCSRPWVGLACATALLGVLWWPPVASARAIPWAISRVGLAAAGGAPFAAALFWWNARLFGGPLELGYAAAFGPAHGLGFHVDPWGNAYGAREALAYTGADLAQLGAHLLETPFPAVAIAGLGLFLLVDGLATRLLMAWVLSALAANALYWHHGIHMGPRMLYESVPAWVALTVAGAAALTGAARPGRMRAVAAWSLAVSGAGALLLLPALVQSARSAPNARSAAEIPAVSGPAVVFVHGSWSSRLVARLAATGMRRDSIETALRRNDVCAVDRYARWRAGGAGGSASELDLEARPGTPAHLRPVELSPGNVVRVDPVASAGPTCLLEARSDRNGTVELEPLAWRAPPVGEGPALARDLGPAVNARVVAAMPGRAAFVYASRSPGSAPELLGYEEGMRLLWADGS